MTVCIEVGTRQAGCVRLNDTGSISHARMKKHTEKLIKASSNAYIERFKNNRLQFYEYEATYELMYRLH